jgi:hypothetical protein
MSFGTCMFCRHKQGNTSKCAFQKVYLSKTTTKPNQATQLGQNTGRGGIQTWLAAHQSKVVLRGLAQGAGAPP